MPSDPATAPAPVRRGAVLRALTAALALGALAACDFGGDAANCVLGEQIDACAERVLGETADVARADAFFARRGFAKDPRVTRTGLGDAHVYARDERGGARTRFMVVTFDAEGAFVGLETQTRRN